MCGINGLFAFHPASDPPTERELLATRDAMARRGPDGAGSWWSADRRVGLGHRRLAIIDLSEAGAQPMVSGDGALAITYNGEIYNHEELRAGLERQGHVFRSHCDTEVLLHLYAAKGEAMLDDLRGMFAFAIWDARKGGLFLARDPYGIKPLYTSHDGWTFRFASQVKALLAGGGVSADPEPAGIVGFHLLGCVPEPFTLYRDVHALPAGHCQWVDAAGPRLPRRYASLAAALASGATRSVPVDEARRSLAAALRDSVRAHMVADVEVGLFLSAGVDSGALLGLMAEVGGGRVTALTLTFDEFAGTADDEAPLAARIADTYGASHRRCRIGQQDFAEVLPQILDDMDQPSIDGINTWLVARAAREAGLKVAVSGLGGDELLGGYPSFRDIPRWVGSLGAISRVPGLGALARRIVAMTPAARATPKLAGMLEYGGTYPGAYLLRRGIYLPFELDRVLDPATVRDGLHRLDLLGRFAGELDPDPGRPGLRVSALESAIYMRNQLLRDADWAGMAHGVEIRTPLVDWTLLRDVAACLPALAGEGKTALAAAPARPLPRDIVDRPKTGFLIPTKRWLAEGAAGPGPVRTQGAVSRHWAVEVFGRARQGNLPVAA